MDIKVVPPERVRPFVGMTGKDLRIWRAQRPGRYAWKNGQTRPGWSQKQAAEWLGVGERTWRRYERPDAIVPRMWVKQLEDYPASYAEIVDRMFMTDKDQVERDQGVHPELAHEPKPDFRGGY